MPYIMSPPLAFAKEEISAKNSFLSESELLGSFCLYSNVFFSNIELSIKFCKSFSFI